MSSSIDLEILKKHRRELLLAEVGAIIHNIGKLSEEFLKYQANETEYENYDYQAITGIVSLLIPSTLTHAERQRLQSASDANHESKTTGLLSIKQKKWLQDRALNLPVPLDDHTYALGDFIEFQKFGWYEPTKGGSPPRITLLFPSGSRASELLEASHNAASGVEKEGTPKDEGKQTNFPLQIATAFGLESPMELDSFKEWRGKLLDSLQHDGRSTSYLAYLEKAVGDTRRPINEVRLSDLSFSVAALFKSALAQAIIAKQWKLRDDLRWRILRVNFDILALYAKAIKIADLLAYQRAVGEACQQIKQLVEEEYPLGNEVYRDSSGIYFTFPDLDLPAELAQEIRRRAEDVEPELAPHIAVTKGDGATAQEQLKGILGKARKEALEALKQPFNTHNLTYSWHKEWDDIQNDEEKKGRWEVCPVCQLRPKEEYAEACQHCEKRRASRLDAWQNDPTNTIWVGEIADHNDRVALLVGKFGLDDWLSGDLVQTMLVKAEENNPAGCTPKNPSPARLRRVWETCQRFWDDTVLQDVLTKELGSHGERKHIIPDKTHWQAGLYNGKVNNKPIDLFWQPEHNAFLSVSNLQAAGELKNGDTITLDTKRKTEFQIQAIRAAPAPFTTYQPCLPLHASPDQFMALVPATDALDIAEKIRCAYQDHFGKVQNRLPLAIGLVFCERKMPLMAVMDAARQMPGRQTFNEPWAVDSKTVEAQKITLTLKQNENKLTLAVPTLMGDDATEDLWYPYFELDGAPIAHHTHQFQHNGKTWVHVKDLQENDKVSLTPSTFDFLWLDSTARRFEIHYDVQGRRPARPTRPFYLEDLARLDKLWKCLQKISRTQLKQTLQTIETARQRWFGHDQERKSITDQTFRQFVEDALANTQWDWKNIPHKDQLISAAVRGELADLEELHLEILKESLQGEPS